MPPPGMNGEAEPIGYNMLPHGLNELIFFFFDHAAFNWHDQMTNDSGSGLAMMGNLE